MPAHQKLWRHRSPYAFKILTMLQIGLCRSQKGLQIVLNTCTHAVDGAVVEPKSINVILAPKLESDSIVPTFTVAPSTTATMTTTYMQRKITPCSHVHSSLAIPCINLHLQVQGTSSIELRGSDGKSSGIGEGIEAPTPTKHSSNTSMVDLGL